LIKKPGIAGSKNGLANDNFPKGFKFHEVALALHDACRRILAGGLKKVGLKNKQESWYPGARSVIFRMGMLKKSKKCSVFTSRSSPHFKSQPRTGKEHAPTFTEQGNELYL
jgi:hypothetical protein